MGRGSRGCGSRGLWVEGRGLWVRGRGGRGGYEGDHILFHNIKYFLLIIPNLV